MNTRLAGVFDDEEAFDWAVQKLKDSGVVIEDIYAPVPVHRAVKNITGRSRIPTIAYGLGILSMLATLAFLYYTAVYDWPLNIGGKPTNAFPSFVVVTLVLTILAVTILSLFIFSFRANLYPGKKTIIIHEKAMDDKFIIVLDPEKVTEASDKLKFMGAEEVIQYNSQNE